MRTIIVSPSPTLSTSLSMIFSEKSIQKKLKFFKCPSSIAKWCHFIVDNVASRARLEIMCAKSIMRVKPFLGYVYALEQSVSRSVGLSVSQPLSEPHHAVQTMIIGFQRQSVATSTDATNSTSNTLSLFLPPPASANFCVLANKTNSRWR